MWICRDKSGGLGLYVEYPNKDISISYHSSSPLIMELDSDLFPEVTFENSPLEVELKVKYECIFTT